MKDTIFKKAIYQMLDLKFSEIRKECNKISFKDFYSYLNEIILKNNNISDINDIAFFILNIKINKIFEYLNIKELVENKSSIELDLKSILES